MTKRKILNIFSAIFGFAFGTMMILVVHKTSLEDKINLDSLSYFTGQLTNFNIDYKYFPSTGTKKKLIAFDIGGLNTTMGMFRPEQDYSDFIENVKIGDTVSIYYQKHSQDNESFTSGIGFNGDIYQLDINHINYLNLAKVKADHDKIKIPITILGLFLYCISIYCLFRK